MAAEQLTFDWNGFRQAMKNTKKSAAAAKRTNRPWRRSEAIQRTEFVGYEAISTTASIKGIIVGEGDQERLVSEIAAADCSRQRLRVVLDKTPFMVKAGAGWRYGHLKASGVDFQVQILSEPVNS